MDRAPGPSKWQTRVGSATYRQMVSGKTIGEHVCVWKVGLKVCCYFKLVFKKAVCSHNSDHRFIIGLAGFISKLYCLLAFYFSLWGSSLTILCLKFLMFKLETILGSQQLWGLNEWCMLRALTSVWHSKHSINSQLHEVGVLILRVNLIGLRKGYPDNW